MTEDDKLRELSARIEEVSDRLEVVDFRKPAVRKPSYIFSPTYAVEVRDRVTGSRFVVSTDELIETGLALAQRIQRRALVSIQLRLAAMVSVLLALIVPAVLVGFGPVPGIASLFALIIAAGLLWRQAGRVQPKELPGLGRQLKMILRPGSTESRR